MSKGRLRADELVKLALSEGHKLPLTPVLDFQRVAMATLVRFESGIFSIHDNGCVFEMADEYPSRPIRKV